MERKKMQWIGAYGDPRKPVTVNRAPGTPVSETRVKPKINRSPDEGVVHGNSGPSYKDMLEAGYSQRMDVNGNYRWVDKDGNQLNGQPLYPQKQQKQTAPAESPDEKEAREIGDSAHISRPEGVDALGIDRQTRESFAYMPAQQVDDTVHAASMKQLQTHRDANRRLDEISDRNMKGLSPGLAAAIQSARDARNEYYAAVEKSYTTQYQAAKRRREADARARVDALNAANANAAENGRPPPFSQAYIDATAAFMRGEMTSDQYATISSSELAKMVIGASEASQPPSSKLTGDQVSANIKKFDRQYAGGLTYEAPEYPQGDDYVSHTPKTDPIQTPTPTEVTKQQAKFFDDPGVARANHDLVAAETQVELTGAENKRQDQKDTAELAQVMGNAADHLVPEDDQKRQNPVSSAAQNIDQTLAELAPQDTVQTEDEKEDQAAEKGGEGDRFATSRSFLATDKVPDTIFGYPVVSRREDYTQADIAFFEKHPEAGGYYDLGEGSPEDGTEEGAPTQDDDKTNPQWDRVDVKGTGHVVYPAAYNSALTDAQEAQYQAWRATLPRNLQYEGDYDLRGYWLDPETVKDNIVDGQHFTDRYKKPNHPTFSTESRYAVGDDARLAGTWNGDKYIPSAFVSRMAPDAVAARTEEAIALAIPFIKKHEGFRTKAYKDSVGKWTVGYGQTEIWDVATGTVRAVRKGDTITEQDAAKFVEQRVRSNAAQLAELIPWARRAGKGAIAQLLDIAYNAGVGALLKDKSPRLNEDGSAAVSEHDVNKVVFREAPSYKYANGKVLRGLVNRRSDGVREFRDKLFALPRTGTIVHNTVPQTVSGQLRKTPAKPITVKEK